MCGFFIKSESWNDDPWRDLESDANSDWMKIIIAIVAAVAIVAISMGLLLLLSLAFPHHAHAHDLDGRYAQNPLHAWFDQLASGKGLCCAFADGTVLKIDDWQTHDGKYQVKIMGRWIDVPDNALVTEPNKAGEAYVWPYIDENSQVQIRCFLPGAGA